MIYYPGSTIGNEHPPDAIRFLQQMRQHCHPGDALLIGVDLEKEPAIVTEAYNGRIVHQFNHVNTLERLNRDFGTDFVISQFQHHMEYNAAQSRVEIYLKSLCDQTVHVGDEAITFVANELIPRTVAYKYSLERFQQLIEQGGWQTRQVWTDDQQWFSVQYLVAV